MTEMENCSARVVAFIGRLLVFALPVVALGGACAWSIFGVVHSPSQAILQHRLQKLARNPDCETVLLGDSSLGNGISESVYSIETRQKTLNLSLNGLYGYAGSWHLLRRAIKTCPDLKNVVLVQTMDMFQRPVARAGNVRMLPSSDWWELPLGEQLEIPNDILQTVFSWDGLSSLESAIQGRDVPAVVNDYLEQLPPTDWATIAPEPFLARDIQPGKEEFLRRIVDLARDNQLNLVYSHGPMRRGIVEISTDYLTAVGQRIRATGCPMVAKIVALDDHELGDSEDHAHPGSRDSVTHRFVQLIAPPPRSRPE